MFYFVTALEDRSWWGLAGRQYLLALISAGADVKFLPLNGNVGFDPTQIDPEFAPILERFGGGGEADATIIHGPLDVVAARALYQPDLIGPNHIALTTWHEDKVPDEFVMGLRSYKEVWVPSNSAESVLRAAGIDHVQVVWTPINVQAWKRTEASRPGDRFVLYAIGKWHEDNLDAVTRAYLKGFQRDEGVLLHLVCPDAPLASPQELAKLAGVSDAKSLARVSVDTSGGRALEKTPKNWRKLHKSCHCYVTASGRSDLDPWTLGAAAAGNLLCGTPAQYAALEEDPVGQSTVDVAEYAEDGVDIEEFSQMMRDVFTRRPQMEKLGGHRIPVIAGEAMQRLLVTLGDRRRDEKPQLEEEEVEEKNGRSKLAVIVPHKDRGRAWLESVWLCLRDQLEPGDLFIVSDQESSSEVLDDVRNFVTSVKGSLVTCEAPESGWSLSLARNAGARVALDLGAELLLFLDADILVPEGGVAKMLETLGSLGFVVPMTAQGEKFYHAVELEKDKQPSLIGLETRPASGCSMIRSAPFAEARGFDESYEGWGSEDIDLLVRLEKRGHSRAVAEDIVLYHQPHADSPYKQEWGPGNQKKCLAVMELEEAPEVNPVTWGLGAVVLLDGEPVR